MYHFHGDIEDNGVGRKIISYSFDIHSCVMREMQTHNWLINGRRNYSLWWILASWAAGEVFCKQVLEMLTGVAEKNNA